jgi:periplasmic divalent cation tolerance protein
MIIPGTPSQCLIAFVTAPDIDTARKIARAALEKKAAACANIIPAVESHYWWEGKIETSAELLIIFKTTLHKQDELRQVVLANHPYEVPEFVAFEIAHGSDPYLRWVRESVAPASR